MAEVTSPRPLAQHDDRSTFDCGRDSLNGWFRRHAWNNHATGASRINVICATSTGIIVGYATLSAGQIERAFLAKSQQRNRPDPIPIFLLGQLAVDKNHHGKGHATSLMLFALRAALRAADIIGSVGIVTHPLDDGVRALYAKWGFQELPHDPRRAMIVRMIDLEQSGITL